ncbi:hypothetical protein [Silvanigrella aquatica]|uniref:Uncharacterized protein n=1 Tax=Silvanigrella aquatica TaxID=1915309 RepID=A0A1L4CY91_9BACT|nr:hypothetical protein [Silvanigrella aquatica]APJ02933.1 hypothetical protein AXG55_02985 [Silvanigrella aquatica]
MTLNLNSILPLRSFLLDVKNYIENKTYFFDFRNKVNREIILPNGKRKKTSLFLKNIYALYIKDIDKKNTIAQTIGVSSNLKDSIKIELENKDVFDGNTLKKWYDKLNLLLIYVQKENILAEDFKSNCIYQFSIKNENMNAYSSLISAVSKNLFDLNFMNKYYDFCYMFDEYLIQSKIVTSDLCFKVLFNTFFEKLFKNKKISTEKFNQFFITIYESLNSEKYYHDYKMLMYFRNLRYLMPSVQEDSISLLGESYKYNNSKWIDVFKEFKFINVFPNYRINDRNHVFNISPYSLKFILKAYSSAKAEQVNADLNRVTISINFMPYNYVVNNIPLENYKIFLNDLKNNKIYNSNVLSFLERYSHQGALQFGWTTILLEAGGKENFVICNKNNGTLYNIDYIHNDTIQVTSIMQFKVINMHNPEEKVLFTKDLAIFFQCVFQISHTNIVHVFGAKMGLLNASNSNKNDLKFLNIFKKAVRDENIIEEMKKVKLGKLKLNNNEFKIH